ncbi:uncharacterized protein IL334_005806 [Kwoniella shivajii]|uniref:Uncharacterized protein n=1 Tax=Kwoniella shivajii TaxID=564305 RepID=A0ABZ1D784_9TREE|nr:hypothetical protein IL334_005806 [Kwoniella shivajii]
MPYIAPGSMQVQPIAVPISKVHQLAEGKVSSTSNDDVSTPKPSDSSSDLSQPTDLISTAESDSNGLSLDSLTSQLASSSIHSTSSTPPLEESSRSQHQSSPAASSVVSLPEQGDGYLDEVKTPKSDTSLKRLADDEEEEGKKVAGELQTQAAVTQEMENDALAAYRERLYAYTHSLWIQAKLSSSRAERRRQSVSIHGFTNKQSGMEKMAAKKALAKRLNG